jgi:hypothetical protein
MNLSFFIFIREKRKIFFISFLCLSLSACSPGFIYQNLRWMIHWYIDDYVTLNEKQQQQFAAIVDETLVWHKEKELPRYRQYLENIGTKLDQPLSESDIGGMQGFMTSSVKNIQQYIAPTLLPLFNTFEEEQKQAFWGELNKVQAEYEKEFLSRSNKEYIEDLNEKYISFTERLLGALTDDQKSVIESETSRIIRADDIWLNARRAWLDDIKFQSEQKTSDWHTRVQAAWLDRDKHYSVESKLKTDKRDQQARQLLLTVINERTDKQTKHFKKFIRNWQNKLTRWEE